MRDRAPAAAGKPPRRVQVSVDAVLLSPRAGELALLLARADARAREKWMLPWDLLRGDEDPDAAVRRSSRRALQAAYLVDPIDEWRSEGRGRPAQLFRYAPRKRRGARRAVRFDLLPG